MKRIKQVLENDSIELPAALRQAALDLESGHSPISAVVRKIIEVIEMQNDSDWATKYYSEDARAKLEAKRAQWTPELQAEAGQDWGRLFRDIEAVLDEDPASDNAQALAARWRTLVEAFTGGDPKVVQGLADAYADRPNWPFAAQQQMADFSNPRVWEFFRKANAARKTEPG